jgi:hypothetical protein
LKSTLSERHSCIGVTQTLNLWLIFFMIPGVTAGCDKLNIPAPRTYWGEGGPGAPGLQPGCNFYTADLDRYPGFAMFSHKIDVEIYTPEIEEAALVAGILRCRQEFGEAFRAKSLVAFDNFSSHKTDWIPAQPRFVRFQPKWVVILLSNREFARKRGDDPLAPSVTVGYVLPAAEMFDSRIAPMKLLKDGFRDDHPIHLDAHATFPGYKDIYSIIERFRARGVLNSQMHQP